MTSLAKLQPGVSSMRAISFLFLAFVLAPHIASELIQTNIHEDEIVTTGQNIPSPFRIVRYFHFHFGLVLRCFCVAIIHACSINSCQPLELGR